MKNYELTCAHCGKKFESNRKDTRYCSNSCRVMASRDRKKEIEPDETSVLIKYSPDEYKKLQRAAKSAGISVTDLVKYRGLTTLEDINGKTKEIDSLKQEVIQLKAHLSVYTKEPCSGIYLPADEIQKDMIRFNLNELDLLGEEDEDYTFEDELIYLGMNSLSLVKKS